MTKIEYTKGNYICHHYISKFFYLKILKYLIPVLSPHTAKSTKDAIITPIILFRYRLPPQIRKIIPITNPNKPKIEPSAIKYSIPPKTSLTIYYHYPIF